jgi:peptide/nickel transport system substrate-binding protein
VAEFRPEELLVLEANEHYWGEPPPAGRLEFIPRPEIAARVSALVSGEVDIITAVPPDQVPVIEGTDGVGVRSVPITNVRMLYYNTRHPVLQDKRRRQALNLAIDRELIVASLWGGRALVPRSYQFSDWAELYNPQRPVPLYDPGAARELLDASGYAGERITLRTPADYYTFGEEVSQAIVEMWRAAGINAEVELIDVAAFWEDVENLTVVTGSNTNEFADPDAFWIRWNASSSNGQHIWTNERFEEIGLTARHTLDLPTRYAAYQELIDLFEEEAPGTVLYVPYENYGLRRGIEWQPYAYYFLDFRADNLSFS